MASTLETLTDAVKAQMGADVPADWGFGEVALNANGVPNRIVWVPKGGQIVDPEPGKDPEFTLDGVKYRARHIYDNVATIHAHLWASDLEKLERMHNRLLCAVRAVFGRGSVPGAYEIIANVAHSHAGCTAAQSFVWRLRVCEATPATRNEAGPYVPAKRLVALAAQSHVCAIDNEL